MQDEVRQRQFVEQRQQGEAFSGIVPSQTQLHGETNVGVFRRGGLQQGFHLFGMGKHACTVVPFGQQWERASQVDIRFTIAFLDEKGHYTLQFVGIRSHELRDEVQALIRSEEHTSELQSRQYLVCRLLLEKK